MNKKGFTLVELLVMLVVLGVISAISIPNIMGILSDTRINIMIDNANKMYDTVKIMEATKKITKPTITLDIGQCKLIKLNKIGTADDYKPSIEGAEINFDQSFVIIKFDNIEDSSDGKIYKYKYYVRLIETKNSKNYGIPLEEVKRLSKDSYKASVESISINIATLNNLNSTIDCTSVTTT